MAPKVKAGSFASPQRSEKPRPTEEGSQEIAKLLEEALPEAAKLFVSEYESVTTHGLLGANLIPARRLGQLVQHLNIASWRRGMSQAQADDLQRFFDEGIVKTLQAILAAAVALNHRSELARGAQTAEVLSAVRLGIEACTLYCELAGVFGAPATLMVEEVNAGVVQCMKQCVRQLVTPLLSPGADTKTGDSLQFKKEETAQLCQVLSGAIIAVHELLCRHKLLDDQVHQLIYICVNVFFLAEPDFRLCAAAEELLVTVFCRHAGMLSSVLQEFLVGVTKLPTGRHAKKFLLPVPQDNPDHGLSTWTHLVLRLMQCTCLPLNEPLGGAIQFDAVLQCRAASHAVVAQLVSGLVQRLLFTRSPNNELRAIFNDITEELLLVCLKPTWPAALATLRTIFYQLVNLIQQKKKDNADATTREFALKVVNKIVCHLSHHKVEAEKACITLPSWSTPQSRVNKDYRLLQHVALRVSLEDARKMPWTAAAKAVQAWDAEVYLKEGDGSSSALSSFTQDIVFRYLIMAHLEDERLVPARCSPVSAGRPTLSNAIFGAAHPVHAWSFLVCDWASHAARVRKETEAQEKEDGEVDLEATNHQNVLERLLAVLWTSPSALAGEGSSSRSGGGRRILLPFIVHKVFRQLQCGAPIEGMLKLGIECMVVQANSPQATLRRTGVKTLGEMIEIDHRLLMEKAVEETLEMRIRDESAWVRQASLDLLGRLLDTTEDEADAPVAPSGDATISDILLRFQQTVRSRINDTSLIVRRQASKILGAFVLTHSEHPDVVPVVLDLLNRSHDSEKLRSMVLHTFELLWFADEEPTVAAAQQLARVVDASGASNFSGSVDILKELLGRLRINLSGKKRSKGYEHAIKRWSTLLLNEFVHMNGSAVVKQKRETADGEDESWLKRRSLLSTLEAFAVAQPKEMLTQMRPLTVYLTLEESSTTEEQWVAQKVCRIISAVLPSPLEKRGIFDHASVQSDLHALIKSQTSTGVQEAVRCLCLIVKYMTGDLGQVVRYIIEAIPALNHYCDVATAYPEKLDRIALLYMSRLLWCMCCILETLSIDMYMEPQGTRLKRDVFPFQLTDGSLATTVLVTLSKLYAVPNSSLKAMVIQCLGFFLCGHRSYMKERSVAQMLSISLTSPDLVIRLRALETMTRLLSHYGREADKESQAHDKVDASAASAIESAQPLAVHIPEVLNLISISKLDITKLIVHRDSDVRQDEALLRIRAEALTVLRFLQQQGLVNPMNILSKAFAMAFSVESQLSEPACVLLKEMLEVRPTILLNRIDDAIHDVFLGALASAHPPTLGVDLRTPLAALGEVYAEIFRKQKNTRETLIRKLLQQVFRLQRARFAELFADLLECGEHPGMASKRRRLLVKVSSSEEKRKEDAQTGGFISGVVSKLPPLRYYQLLYSQFVATMLSALPFQYESEPLLVVYECNRHLSLVGGTLSNAVVTDVEKEQSKDCFAEAISMATCLALKSAMKVEYALTTEQCVQYNPKDIKQERLKGGRYDRLKGVGEGDAAPNASHPCFPVAEWSRLASSLASAHDQPAKIATLLREAIDSSPWDSSFSRYAAKLDQLEGRTTKKPREGRVSAAGRGGRSGRGGRGGDASGGGRGRKRRRTAGKDSGDDEDVEEVDDAEDEDFVP